jgi:hypothetical protein
MSMALVQCDQKTSKFFVLCRRIHGRKHGYIWSLLKITKGSMVGAQVEYGGQESVLLLFMYF